MSLLCCVATAHASEETFPMYDAIIPNVDFWVKVYSEYPTTKGLIHDSYNLAVIYEVLDLLPRDQPGARRTNKKRVKRAKKKYQDLLIKLSKGYRPVTAEEKRIRSLWGPVVSPEVLAKAAESIRFQLCQKDRFIPGIIRSGAFLDEIKEIFRQNGLPTDLAYLPHVESSFNYKAYSKFGAAGIWQFTRATGRRFMTVDYTLDERRDPIISAHAAARFLKENYELLGNWPLAITAYNHGTNGMLRAKKQLGGYEPIFSKYNGRRFKFASRNFYSEFLAARKVAKNYRHHFGNLDLDRPQSYLSVSLPGFISAQDVSRHFKVDLVTLEEINPALRHPVFEGRKYIPKGYSLRLPERNSEMLQLAEAIPDSMFQPRQRRSRFYRVERGDTAGVIARRHGVKLHDLIMANGLGNRATIYAGQNLRIPVPEEKVVPIIAQAAKKSEKKVLVAMAEVEPESVLVSPEKSIDESLAEVPLIPVLTVEQEQGSVKDNAITKGPSNASEIAVNQSIVIGNLQVENVKNKDGRILGEIEVEVGETLGHYADWLGVPTREIRRLNGFRFGRPIHIGQTVKLEFSKIPTEDFEEKRYEFHKEIEEDFFAAYSVEGARLYRIQQGDTIWALSLEEFDLPLWIVKKYNSVHDFNNLIPGREMIIPVVKSRLQEAERVEEISVGKG
jgi:membrane-bound lytic murein transglycosylase D